MKTAFIFPGQGAQYVGMGLEISEKYDVAKKTFLEANEALGFDIKKLCFEGPKEELVKTEITQPAILTTSVAILRVLESLGLNAETTAGLSLGEYASLVYSEVFNFSDAVRLVNKRGKYMQEAVPLGKGTMAAIIGLDREEVEGITKKISNEKGIVECANYNCPGQIVISGEVTSVEKSCELAKEKGAKRALVLPVSAPFHSSLLTPAGDKLEKELNKVNFGKMNKKVISNVTGEYINDTKDIKDLLIKQVSMPVLWEDTVNLMLNDGIDTFIEIGPGKSLRSFVKKTARKRKAKVNCSNIENLKGLNKLLEKL
ncbi:MAG: ACP S-malonyltransferase [Firmicutes bacterium]|nr:ACP S-malonyltransferase [Bacillota bacterium]